MDSGNSGSLQSSSGGDEEYESRAAAHSLFMTTHSPSHLRPISTAPPPPPLFDPLSNYLQLHNPDALPLNPNMPWPRPASMRSDPNPSTPVNPPIIFQSPKAPLGETSDHLVAAQNQNTAARNPRKRSRASRRAPTTVLTTDTTNFRAMVQEFTGIPSPPFNSSSFSRSRLDLFTSAFEAPPPPYLRRPFAEKAESPPPFLASSTAISISSSSMNYQLPAITQNSNLFNVQNPINLTSLLQSNPRFLLSSPNAITSKTHDQDSFGIPTSDDHFDDRFGLRHHENHVSTTLINGLPNLVSPDQIGAEKYPNHDIDKNAESSRLHHQQQQQHQIKTTTATTTVSGGGYSFLPSGFRGGKGPENIAARGEGMVDSWICSSE
ncbi:hypothetical protein C2S52_021206 [Perilla frutescens var. hirtella]|nr:hypothetical protein C2S52_021206 [Perilla frutescens var. hirtella]